MYVQHRKEAKVEKKKAKETNQDESIFKDVMLTTGPKETQISSPIINGFSTGVDNAGFEMDKTGV